MGAAALLAPVGPLVAPAAVTLSVSVDASLGLHGTIYTWLYDSFPPLRGFRAPARFRAIAGLYLALLTGFAVAALARRIETPWGTHAALSALGIVLLVELHPTLELQPLSDHPPNIYQFIPDPHAVVADLPLSWDQDPFWHDSVYMYFSTFHWHPIVNGASGTEYFVLHEGYYQTAFGHIVSDVEVQPRLQFVAAATCLARELARLWAETPECRRVRVRRSL
jgi:hypothetical protein